VAWIGVPLFLTLFAKAYHTKFKRTYKHPVIDDKDNSIYEFYVKAQEDKLWNTKSPLNLYRNNGTATWFQDYNTWIHKKLGL
jgi:hypothetical protein